MENFKIDTTIVREIIEIHPVFYKPHISFDFYMALKKTSFYLLDYVKDLAEKTFISEKDYLDIKDAVNTAEKIIRIGWFDGITPSWWKKVESLKNWIDLNLPDDRTKPMVTEMLEIIDEWNTLKIMYPNITSVIWSYLKNKEESLVS